MSAARRQSPAPKKKRANRPGARHAMREALTLDGPVLKDSARGHVDGSDGLLCHLASKEQHVAAHTRRRFAKRRERVQKVSARNRRASQRGRAANGKRAGALPVVVEAQRVDGRCQVQKRLKRLGRRLCQAGFHVVQVDHTAVRAARKQKGQETEGMSIKKTTLSPKEAVQKGAPGRTLPQSSCRWAPWPSSCCECSPHPQTCARSGASQCPKCTFSSRLSEKARAGWVRGTTVAAKTRRQGDGAEADHALLARDTHHRS